MYSFQDYDSQPAEFVDIDPDTVISAAPYCDGVTDVHWQEPGLLPQTRRLCVQFGQFVEMVGRSTGRGVTFETDNAPLKRVELPMLSATDELPF